MRSKTIRHLLTALLALALIAGACTEDSSDSGDGGSDDSTASGDAAPGTSDDIDYEAIGLWDDGPCDPALDPLVLGQMTVFESALLSLEDSALALEASAEAFNARGGANGACIEVHTCDDGADANQAIGCVDEIEGQGVVATVNDQGTTAQDEVSTLMAEAGIPRVAGNVTSDDWDDQNAYPLDASGTGVTFLLPQALINEDISEIGLIRVDLPEAGALVGLLEDLYAEDATFVSDAPVPAGTTDYSQFILAAEDAGAGGVTLALGEQEAIQVVNAGQQLGTELRIGSSLGTFSQATVAELGDFAQQMVFLWSFAPATADLPVYEALRSDLAASGEEGLQPTELKASPMRSWIGLYALLQVLREAGVEDFTSANITTALEAAVDVPMLDMFGGENWTPDLDHPGIFQRAGTNNWSTYTFDPEDDTLGFDGTFVHTSDFSFDDVLCGSPFGAAGPC